MNTFFILLFVGSGIVLVKSLFDIVDEYHQVKINDEKHRLQSEFLNILLFLCINIIIIIVFSV